MSLFPCSRCHERGPGKLASVTWAWYRADGQRVAYRQKLDMPCVAAICAPLIQAVEEWSLNCAVCHIDASDDLDAVYLTAFWPGRGKESYEFPLCSACAVEIRNRAQEGADKLESREFGGQDSGPQTMTPDAWAQLGIRPR